MLAGFSDRQFDEWLEKKAVDWNLEPSEEFQPVVEFLECREVEVEHTELYNYRRYSKIAFFFIHFRGI